MSEGSENSIRRLAVVPSDPLQIYTDKGIGHWLTDYFNPLGFFQEVYCLSPLETHERFEYGMRVIPTPAEAFANRLVELQIDIVRAYGGYRACDLACDHRAMGIPVIVSVHDTKPDLLHESILRADHVLSVSGAVRELLLSRGVEPGRIHDFANRVDLDLFRRIVDPAQRAVFEARYPGRYRILHIGRKDRQKNLDTLIRALAELGPDYVAIIIGPNDDTFYRDLADSCGVADRCTFIESVSNRELPSYYSFCDCMCTPSRWEGFGIVFVEALACKAVVVTSDIGPMNEFIRDGESGLLVADYENPRAIADAIRRACTDNALRNHLRRRARAAAEPFSKPAVDRREVELYALFLREVRQRLVPAYAESEGAVKLAVVKKAKSTSKKALSPPGAKDNGDHLSSEPGRASEGLRSDADARGAAQEGAASRSDADSSSSETHTKERDKWDQYYSQLSATKEWTTLKQFNEEFVSSILKLLPEGGRILEAGCGGGYQSLALGRTGRLQATLLDFSTEALSFARRLFEEEKVEAEFIQADASERGTPDFDLVFSAGVLEHYTFDEQVEVLRGMASRSRRYVLSLVPNRACYWYWLWRTQVTAKGEWPFGGEVPVLDQVSVFKAAGIEPVGLTFFGAAWTEDFIRQTAGLSDELRDEILQIHRSPAISEQEKSYLVATLGVVGQGHSAPLPGWFPPSTAEPLDQATLAASLSDALALRISAEHHVRVLQARCTDAETRLTGALASVEELTRTVAQRETLVDELRASVSNVGQLNDELSLNLQATLQKLGETQEQVTVGEAKAEALQAEIATLQQREQWLTSQCDTHSRSAHDTTAQLTEIQGSSGWAMLQGVRRVRRMICPDGSLRHRALRKSSWFVINLLRAAKWRQWVFRQRARAWLRAHGFPTPMSWYAFAFDRFKRSRARQVTTDLRTVYVPMEKDLVSIVLPVYNGDDYVGESIDSVLAQTYPKFELIVVNDGSTDRTPEILDAYARRDSRIRVIHQQNQKLPRSLSNGFRTSLGEFLTWTSADNRLKPDFLAKMMESLRRHPAWEMIYANEAIIGDDGQPLLSSPWFQLYQKPLGSEHVHFPTDVGELNTWSNNFVGAAFMYRARALFLLGDYNGDLFGLEDYDYWMKLNDLLTLRHSDFDEPVYDYRFHPKSLTSRDKELKITQRREQMMVFDDFRRDFALTPMVWRIDAGAETKANNIASRLKDAAQQMGHLFPDFSMLPVKEWPRLWTPCVYVKVVSNPDEAGNVPADLPACALKVLLVTGDEPLRQQMDAQWDLCIAWSSSGEAVRLSLPRQGWLVTDTLASLLAALDVRARSDHLAAIEAENHATQQMPCKLSVVICTCRRSERLVQAITSASKQTLGHEDYEIIVVNNAASDTSVREKVDQLRTELFFGDPQRLRMLTCALPGLSFARNAGLGEARGEVVCFLDDDAIAMENWLEETWKAYQEHELAGVVGGRIILKLPDEKPSWLQPDWYAYWSHFWPGCEEYTEVQHWWEFPYGANWTARRRALLEIGGFRTAYGRIRNDYGGGEELVAASLIQRIGYAVAVAPRSQVHHDVAPDRFTFKHVWNTIRSATHVIYQTQRDLYIPMEASLSGSFKKMVKFAFRGVFSRRAPWAERKRRFGYAYAEMTLLGRQMADRLRRRCKPFVLID